MNIKTTVDMLISTIVIAVTCGGVSDAAVGAVGSGRKSLVQKQLDKLRKFLKCLTGKAMDALPGILGSIVSFFLRTAAKVIEFVAQHFYLKTKKS